MFWHLWQVSFLDCLVSLSEFCVCPKMMQHLLRRLLAVPRPLLERSNQTMESVRDAAARAANVGKEAASATSESIKNAAARATAAGEHAVESAQAAATGAAETVSNAAEQAKEQVSRRAPTTAARAAVSPRRSSSARRDASLCLEAALAAAPRLVTAATLGTATGEETCWLRQRRSKGRKGHGEGRNERSRREGAGLVSVGSHAHARTPQSELSCCRVGSAAMTRRECVETKASRTRSHTSDLRNVGRFVHRGKNEKREASTTLRRPLPVRTQDIAAPSLVPPPPPPPSASTLLSSS